VTKKKLDQAMPTILVCSLENLFLDNLTARCDTCGRTIYYRPHAPRLPQMMCILCYLARETADDVRLITPQTLHELLALNTKPKGVH
jgi:hypothetical protein